MPLYYPGRVGVGGLRVRVRLSVGMCVCVCVCVIKKHGCLQLTVQKAPQKLFKTLGFAILILQKTPRKSREPCAECYRHAFLIASQPIRTIR